MRRQGKLCCIFNMDTAEYEGITGFDSETKTEGFFFFFFLRIDLISSSSQPEMLK